MSGSGIHIKKENRGKFTAYKKRTGKTTEQALHSKNPHVRQMANFARNAEKWHHEYGGYLFGDGGAVSDKISLLSHEGYPQKQAVAITLDMQRRGKLADGGDLVPPPPEHILPYIPLLGDLRNYADTHTGAVGRYIAQKYADEEAKRQDMIAHPEDYSKLSLWNKGTSKKSQKKVNERQERAYQKNLELKGIDAVTYASGGGLSRAEDYGSSKKPYPSVKSGDFAGGGRSYPIPTKADAVDALRLAGLHGRSDVRAKVYARYPELRHEYGGLLMDEYKIGGWLKEHGAGLLSGAGGLVSMIPGVGQIAGPILSVAGRVIGNKQAQNAEIDARQSALDAQAEEQKKLTLAQDRQVRMENIIDRNQIDYGPSFMAFGGPIGMGMMDQPQITDYTKGNTHQEGIGGIPVDSKGNPSTTSKTSAVGMTERGEVTWNGYVFSNKIKVKK